MKLKTKSEIVIAGKTVNEWDKCWEHVPDGFTKRQSHLRCTVGLFAATLGVRIMCIVSATQLKNGGLRAGLARPRLKRQSNNSNWGMLMIKEHLDDVEAYIIPVMTGPNANDDIAQLKEAMIALHNPEWNAPDSVVKSARIFAYQDRARKNLH